MNKQWLQYHIFSLHFTFCSSFHSYYKNSIFIFISYSCVYCCTNDGDQALTPQQVTWEGFAAQSLFSQSWKAALQFFKTCSPLLKNLPGKDYVMTQVIISSKATQNIATFVLLQPPRWWWDLIALFQHTHCQQSALLKHQAADLGTIYWGCGRSSCPFSLFSFLPTPPTARRPFQAAEANRTAGTGLGSFFWHQSFNCTCIIWEGLGWDVKLT